MINKLTQNDILILSGSINRRVRIDEKTDEEIKRQFNKWLKNRIHLRAAGDKEKTVAFKHFAV